MKTVNVFTVMMNPESGRTYVKPNLHERFGVKSITIELNDGTIKELTGKNALFVNDPRERIDLMVKNGKLSEEQGEEKKEKLGNVIREIALPLE